jgi:hypothetical protein
VDLLLPDEPQGWRELCARIQEERDTEKLAILIKDVNSRSRHMKRETNISRELTVNLSS